MSTPIRLAGVVAGLFISLSAGADALRPVVDVYKSPTCGCCTKWVKHLERNGFEVRIHQVPNPGVMRERLGMPDQYGACHTATVSGYTIEGHVPAQDMKRLLAERPGAVGIAVPSMPPGSPGMESREPVPYDSLLVNTDGSAAVYARH